MDWGAIIAGGGGVTSLVLAILWTGTGDKPRWVAGSLHREALADKDRQVAKADDRADRATTLSERTIAVAEAMMTQIRGQGRP